MVAKLGKDAFKNAIAEAKVNAKRGFNDFEDGQYLFKLISYAIQKGKDNSEQVIGKWKCMSDEEKDKEFVKFFSIEKALGILLQEWRAIGYDTDQMEETYEGLVKWCKMITKESPSIMATIYQKKGYPTLRVDEVLGETGGGEEVETETPPPKTTAAPTAPKATPKAAAKVAEVAEVADVEDVADVADVAEDGGVDVVEGTKLVFTWKGAEKEGVVSSVDEAAGLFKVLADNGGTPGKFPVKPDMIVRVIK